MACAKAQGPEQAAGFREIGREYRQASGKGALVSCKEFRCHLCADMESLLLFVFLTNRTHLKKESLLVFKWLKLQINQSGSGISLRHVMHLCHLAS